MKRIIFAVLSVMSLLFAACSGESGPKTIHVKTAREFVEALGSNRTIIIDSDIDDITSAIGDLVNEGKLKQIGDVTDPVAATVKPTITATDAYDGPSLNIISVENLTIEGGDPEGMLTSFIVDPSYANVLAFYHCKNITLKNLYMGHKVQDGCSGDVIHLDGCSNVKFERAHLFGCGVIGLYAESSDNIEMVNSAIFDCSDMAMYMTTVSNVSFVGCSFSDFGNSSPCRFESDVRNVSFSNCEFDQPEGWYEGSIPSSEISFNNCFMMNVGDAGCDGEADCDGGYDVDFFQPLDLGLEVVNGSCKDQTIHVKTAEEFVKALGNNRTVIVDNDIMDLTEKLADMIDEGIVKRFYDGVEDVPDQGFVLGAIDVFDGPGLVIANVHNLRIEGKKPDTHIQTTAAYMQVLTFWRSSNVEICNMKLGHKKTSTCVGDVLNFDICDNININGCKLYGCGVIGISANMCNVIRVSNSDIFDCSQSGFEYQNVRNASFNDCKFYELPYLGGETESSICFNTCDIIVEVWDNIFGDFVINNNCKIQYDREPECAL